MLERLQGDYDAVFSLGGHCLPSIQLDKNGLRPYAGPLDWMISGNLSQISRLLDARFAGFMDYASLRVTGHDYGEYNFMVEDTSYEITAAHHFPVTLNTSKHLTSILHSKRRLIAALHVCWRNLRLRPVCGWFQWRCRRRIFGAGRMRCGAICWKTSGCASEHLEGTS
ncbi:UNVERIFIED_CONTAM: hypothetical protein ABIC26_001341 [Paenibacillus sp. PvR008]